MVLSSRSLIPFIKNVGSPPVFFYGRSLDPRLELSRLRLLSLCGRRTLVDLPVHLVAVLLDAVHHPLWPHVDLPLLLACLEIVQLRPKRVSRHDRVVKEELHHPRLRPLGDLRAIHLLQRTQPQLSKRLANLSLSRSAKSNKHHTVSHLEVMKILLGRFYFNFL